MVESGDISGFFADDSIDLKNYIIETYFFETYLEPRFAAASLCSEHSTAQWSRPGVNEDFRDKFGAKVLDLDVLEESSSPMYALPVIRKADKYFRCRVRIANPHVNFGSKIPNILTTAAGEGVFFCPGITTIKLVDLEFPPDILLQFKGPKYGVAMMRDILKIYDRPFFVGVVKPNVGLNPRDFANIAYEAWIGGLDIAKDDEMLADVVYSPFAERVKYVGEAKRRAEDRTGCPKMFVANITDEIDMLLRHHDEAVEAGVNAVMLNVFAVGLPVVRWLADRLSVPLVAHFDFIAPFTRIPGFGISTPVTTKLQRLCGCDVIIMPGFGDRMMTPDAEVMDNVSECLCEWGNIKASLPVPGGSAWAGTLPRVYKMLGTVDFGFVSGRGVFNHPMGAQAGARSIVQAWDAIKSKVDLFEYAKGAPELASALSTWW